MNDTDYIIHFEVRDKAALKAKKKSRVYRLKTEVPVELLDGTIRYALNTAQKKIDLKK